MDDDCDDKDDSKRRTRNLSEKKRRDQFNMLVTELSTLITTNNRKMDKSTILKSTITFLKNHHEVTVRSRAHDIQEDWKPAFLSNDEFTYLVLEALEGFVMVFSSSGQIYYVSESITSLLGHDPVEMVNNSIFDLIYEEDRTTLFNLLQKNANATEQMQNHSIESEVVRFQIHLRRGTLDFREEVTYDLVQFYGYFRINQELNDRDIINFRDIESRVIFVCIGKLHTPQLIREVSLVDSSRNEFTSRHSLEWKFLYLDHRAPPIIGYLPFEVLGTSGYDYYHFDDLEKVVTCHQALMEKGELTSCFYRFLTKGQQWIWLQTRYYITYHQWNSKPEFVVCTHQVISNADLLKLTKEEDAEQENEQNEADVNQINNMEETPADDPALDMSPTFIADTNAAYGNPYQPIPQKVMNCTPINFILPSLTPQTYPSVTVTDAFGNAYQLVSKPAVKTVAVDSPMGTIHALPATGPIWAHCPNHQYIVGCDNLTVSREPRSCQRNGEQELQKPLESVTPQHGIGVQYLDPSSYAGAALLPRSTLPVVSSDQAQVQDQLQRKHEELQQMIVRQQEELRRVKEQLLLARLGLLQPLINVPNPYSPPEDVQNQQRVTAQIEYPNSSPQGVVAVYPQQVSLPQLPSLPSIESNPSQPAHAAQPPQPPHPPHPTNHHQHNMPQ